MATVRKLSSGKWQAIIRRAGQKLSKTFDKKLDATQWAARHEAEILRGDKVDASAAHGHSFADLVDRYVSEVAVKKQSQGHDKSAAKTIRAWFKDTPLASITPDLVFAFCQWRTEEGGAINIETLRKDLQTIGGTVKAAKMLWGLPAPVNPVPDVKARLKLARVAAPAESRERRLLPHEEAMIMAWQPRRKAGHRIKLIVSFALETAMRRGEIAALNWADVDRRRKVIKIRESKTDHKTGVKGRTIPLTDRALEVLDTLAHGKPGDLIFNGGAGSITQAFNRVVSALGFPDLNFHDLRHEATSRLFERGLSIPEVASITGHADWASLKRYTQLRPEAVGAKLRDLVEVHQTIVGANLVLPGAWYWWRPDSENDWQGIIEGGPAVVERGGEYFGPLAPPPA